MYVLWWLVTRTNVGNLSATFSTRDFRSERCLLIGWIMMPRKAMSSWSLVFAIVWAQYVSIYRKVKAWMMVVWSACLRCSTFLSLGEEPRTPHSLVVVNDLISITVTVHLLCGKSEVDSWADSSELIIACFVLASCSLFSNICMFSHANSLLFFT